MKREFEGVNLSVLVSELVQRVLWLCGMKLELGFVMVTSLRRLAEDCAIASLS